MDEHTVGDLDGDFDQVFMAAMHGVAGLECGGPRPTPVFEHFAGFGRADVKIGKVGRKRTFVQYRHRPGQIDRLLRHHPSDSRVGRICCFIDVLAFQRFVIGVFFSDRHDRHDDPLVGIHQRDLFANLNGIRNIGIGGQGYRDRPEHTVFQRHIDAGAVPVGL